MKRPYGQKPASLMSTSSSRGAQHRMQTRKLIDMVLPQPKTSTSELRRMLGLTPTDSRGK